MTALRRSSRALAGAACALAVVAPAHGAGASHTVLHYGDSLAVGTGLFLPADLPGWTVRQSSAVSRHAYDAPAALRSFGGTLPRVLVLSLGTNDDPGATRSFASTVREVVRIAGPQRCVIWSTIARPPYNGVSYRGYNTVLRRTARADGGFHVFDWEALAHAHPQWFGSDGVHPTATGYRVRADALARLVRSC